MVEKIIPIALIRAHLKIDDDPTVSDMQLNLYRAAAVEAFESVTGVVISGERTVTQTIRNKVSRIKHNGRFVIKLDSPTSDGVITLYGGNLPQAITIFLAPGDTRAFLDNVGTNLNFSCCSPCGSIKQPLTIVYKTGGSCDNKTAPGIVIGCLKYIAWQVQNPGDAATTNNAVYASGAYEEWRRYIGEIAF